MNLDREALEAAKFVWSCRSDRRSVPNDWHYLEHAITAYLAALSIRQGGSGPVSLIEGMSDEEFNRDRSDENPNAGKLSALSPAQDDCICQRCQKPIEYDLIVPDEVWATISPKPVEGWKGGGLLCPDCIVKALLSSPAQEIADKPSAVSVGDGVLVDALKLAREWLSGWASAEHQLSVIDAALSTVIVSDAWLNSVHKCSHHESHVWFKHEGSGEMVCTGCGNHRSWLVTEALKAAQEGK